MLDYESVQQETKFYYLCSELFDKYYVFGVDKKNQLDVTFCILYFSSLLFLSTLNYDARSTTHQIMYLNYTKLHISF